MRRNMIIIGMSITIIAMVSLLVGASGLRNVTDKKMSNYTDSLVDLYAVLIGLGFILSLVGILIAITGAILKNKEQKNLE